MSLRSNLKTILVKSESIYGTDPTPDGTANAILVRSLEVQPLNAETASRNLIRPYLGNSDLLIASRYSVATFEVELAGAGTAGVAPGVEPCLKACGFSPSTTTIAISSITRTSTTATVTTSSPHGKIVGDVVKISGATETDYNGNVTILTVADSTHFTYTVANSPATPATGTPILNSAVVYSPISASFVSATIYYNVDGLKHSLTGCFGNFDVSLSAKNIPVLKFTFTGLYNAPSDTAAPTCDFSSFQRPKVANTSNTPSFSLFSYSGVLESMEIALGNDVQYRTLIGLEEVKLVDRKPSGTFKIEAPTIAAKDFWTIANAGTTGAMSLTHGTVGGNIVKLDAPRVSIGNPSYESAQGVEMLSIPFNISPSSGNDELTLTYK